MKRLILTALLVLIVSVFSASCAASANAAQGSEAGSQVIRNTDIGKSKRWFFVGFLSNKNRRYVYIFAVDIISCAIRPARL